MGVSLHKFTVVMITGSETEVRVTALAANNIGPYGEGHKVEGRIKTTGWSCKTPRIMSYD